MTKLKIMPHAVGAYLKGVGVERVELDAHNHFIVHLDNGETVDAGEFKVDYALSSTSSRPLANKTIMALKGALETMISRTQESIDNRINALVGNNATTAIDNFNEIISFFEGVTDSETLVAKIAEINASIAAEQSRVNDELANRVEKVDGKVLSSNDYTNEEKAQVAKIGGKQDTLSLTVKDNGNIVLGNIAGQTKEFMPATPSGDPMHYAYEAAGAIWNANTKYWELNTLTDITTEQMRQIYNLGFLNMPSIMLGGSPMSNVRTNLGRTGRTNYTQAALNILAFAYENQTIEVINLSTRTASASTLNNAGLTSLNGINTAFYKCSKLRIIYGEIMLAKVDPYYTQNAFNGCAALEEVRIQTLSSLSFADSPKLSKASILYLVQKSAPTTAITISLHSTAYAMAKADSEIQSALSSKPNITLISA